MIDTILQRWSIHLQAADFYMMIDTDQGAHMIDDLPHSILDILNWYYPTWKTPPTPGCLHVSRELTACSDTPSRSTRYGLCCTNSSYPSRASFRYGNEIYQNCRLNSETHSGKSGKRKQRLLRVPLTFIFDFQLYYHPYYLLTSSSLSLRK